MSRFYEVTRKGASGGGGDRRKGLGTGETLAPVIQTRRPLRQDTPSPAVFSESHGQHNLKRREGLSGCASLSIVRKHWRISALFAAVLMVTVIVVVFSMKPIYEPVARIEVDPPGEQFSLEGGSVGKRFGVPGNPGPKSQERHSWRWTLSTGFTWTKVP